MSTEDTKEDSFKKQSLTDEDLTNVTGSYSQRVQSCNNLAQDICLNAGCTWNSGKNGTCEGTPGTGSSSSSEVQS